jgi:hypothetical protein
MAGTAKRTVAFSASMALQSLSGSNLLWTTAREPQRSEI